MCRFMPYSGHTRWCIYSCPIQVSRDGAQIHTLSRSHEIEHIFTPYPGHMRWCTHSRPIQVTRDGAHIHTHQGHVRWRVCSYCIKLTRDGAYIHALSSSLAHSYHSKYHYHLSNWKFLLEKWFFCTCVSALVGWFSNRWNLLFREKKDTFLKIY